MGKPILLVVDDDKRARLEIAHYLRRRYGADYWILSASDGQVALSRLSRLNKRNEEVALLLADQRMPRMSGIEFLTRAHDVYPDAKRALLVAFRETLSNVPVLQAMALGRIDYYLAKPAVPPEERLYPIIGEFLRDWARVHRPRFEAVRIVGDQWTPRAHELRDLFARNGVPAGFYPADSEKGAELLRSVHNRDAQGPVVITYDGRVFVEPSNAQMANALGAKTHPDPEPYDVVIVGAGPAGLAAAVYGGSEGLRTLILECEAVGGQAGTSPLIRNHLGFPRGISGSDLAVQAYRQAWLFGASFVFMQKAERLGLEGRNRVVTLSDGTEIISRTVVIATGVSYRRLGAPTLERLRGAGVFYGASISEAQAMKDQEVFIVGAGNSAGQAALHFAKYAVHVTLVVRGDSLAKKMSDYLVKEIEATSNIAVLLNTDVIDGRGTQRLEGLVLRDRVAGVDKTVSASALFAMIGAEPRTQWLSGTLARDDHGFILTDRDLVRNDRFPGGWMFNRPPFLLETSAPGVFAVGDVRHGSVKRVASAVGDGAMAIRFIHEYLDQTESSVSSTAARLRVPTASLSKVVQSAESACGCDAVPRDRAHARYTTRLNVAPSARSLSDHSGRGGSQLRNKSRSASTVNGFNLLGRRPGVDYVLNRKLVERA
jgi:thioredoxin reductase (NADPH)